MEELSSAYGWLSIVPPLVVIVVSILLRSSFEGLLIGCVAGFILIDGWGFFDGFISSLYTVMSSEDTIWVIVIWLGDGIDGAQWRSHEIRRTYDAIHEI